MTALGTLPSDTLGADLVWWRSAGNWRTVVTVFWAGYHNFPQAAFLDCILFNADGVPTSRWELNLDPACPLIIDSERPGPWSQVSDFDGLLALYVCTRDAVTEESRKRFVRLYPVVDWFSPAGDMSVLHSDQVVKRGKRKEQKLTEIVLTCDEAPRTSIVVLNGEDEQEASALSVTISNAEGITRDLVYPTPMSPFTVHRLQLGTVLPDISVFAGDAPVTVSGVFKSVGLYSRPYVVVDGKRWTAYHAGDFYNMPPLPFPLHALLGGEVNPMAVRITSKLQTVVNILHSHGQLEDDVWVNASLFGADGTLVGYRERWLLARRNKVSVAPVADLLGDGVQDFSGHVALSFEVVPGRAVPRRLQALLEYRFDGGAARIMAWSDEWNSPLKLRARLKEETPPVLRSYFRVFLDDDIESTVSITNAGHRNYQQSASVTVLLLNSNGERVETKFNLAPYASLMTPVSSLFPDAREFLGSPAVGVLIAESTSDLANVCFTEHKQSGVVSAEHFLCMETEHNGTMVTPAGA